MENKITTITLENDYRLELNENPFGKIWRKYDPKGNLISEDYSSNVYRRYLYDSNGNLKKVYDPAERGAVLAIRIYFEGDHFPMAELVFAFDTKTEIIEWANPTEREMYSIGINAYTVIYDERFKRPFDSWRHKG